MLKPLFFYLNLSVSNGIISSNMYNKRGNCNFDSVNFPFLDCDIPPSPSYRVYIF